MRDSLELASLASSSPQATPSTRSSLESTQSSRASLQSRHERPTHSRAISISSAFDFTSSLYPLTTSTGIDGNISGYAPLNSTHTSSYPIAGTRNNNLGTTTSPRTPGGSLERHKSLTFLNGLSLIVGLIIGSGIFSSPSQVNRNVGSPGASLVIWTVAGILAWTGASSYAELGGMIPLSGGAAVYLSKMYGDWAGFLYTWVAATVLKPGGAAITGIILGEYTVRAWQGSEAMDVDVWLNKSVAMLVLCIVGFFNCVSTKMVMKTSDVLMFFKFLALIAVGIIGLVVAFTGFSYKGEKKHTWKDVDWFADTSRDPSDWAIALYAGLWAYDGWDTTCFVTGEFINPKRDVPRSIHTALALVIVSYLLANIAYTLVLPMAVINSSNTVAVAFGRHVFGPVGAIAFALIVSCSCYGSLAATTFTTSRLIYAASRQGLFPTRLAQLGWRKGTAIRLPVRTNRMSKVARLFADDAGFFYTPIIATASTTAVSLVYVTIGDFETLTAFYGVAGYTFYFMTVLGLIILRVKEPDLERPYKCWISTPIIFCAVSLFLLSRAVFAQPLQTLAVVVFITTGIPLYLFKNYLANKNRAKWKGGETF